jgi:hypothetical protein
MAAHHRNPSAAQMGPPPGPTQQVTPESNTTMCAHTGTCTQAAATAGANPLEEGEFFDFDVSDSEHEGDIQPVQQSHSCTQDVPTTTIQDQQINDLSPSNLKR